MKVSKTKKGRAVHAIESTITNAWYHSHGWRNNAHCGELVGEPIEGKTEDDVTCKDCLAKIQMTGKVHRQTIKVFGLEVHVSVEVGGETTGSQLRRMEDNAIEPEFYVSADIRINDGAKVGTSALAKVKS